jgi:hypothetical protein
VPRQTSQSCGLSGTFLDIIVVLVVGHKLNVPFRTLARAINGEATVCQGDRKGRPGIHGVTLQPSIAGGT